MNRLLIVDDDDRMRAVIKSYAESAGYITEEACDGAIAVEKVNAESYDIITMDILMPHMDGFDACSRIRETSSIPIIIVSELSDQNDKIRGFELGADDYVVKPFSPRELIMRIRAVVNRTYNSCPEKKDHSVYMDGGMVVDFSARTVTVDGKDVNFTPKEYELLFYMIKNRGIALTRSRIISSVWGCDYYGDERTLDTHIKKLRKGLGQCGDRIVTLRGVGYKFKTESE